MFLIGKYDSNKNGSEGSRGTVALGWGLSSYLYHPRWTAPLVSLPTRHNAVKYLGEPYRGRHIPVVLVQYTNMI